MMKSANNIPIPLDRNTLKQVLDEKTKDCDPTRRAHCAFTDCTLHTYCSKKMTNKKMIRKFCLNDCMNGLTSEVRECPSADCPFYPYRIGRNTETTKKQITAPETHDLRQ
jgi:hypothetical protein